MARDFDFHRRTEKSAEFGVAPTHLTQPITSPRKPKPTASRKAVAPLILVIVGLAAAATGLYYWSSQPPTASAPATNKSTSEQSASDTTTNSDKNVFKKTDELVVQIYQSGAVQEAINQTEALLKEKGFTVENLGNSQFEYDKTYIWHTAEYTEKAKELGSLLTGRVVSYKESQNAGLFDVLIYLGKQ